MSEHLNYWENHYSKDKFRIDCGSHSKPFKVFTRNFIFKNRYQSVLDCGAGLFSEYYGFKNDGVDIDYSAVEITDKYIEEGKSNGIDVVKSNIDHMPFADESIDCVFCHDVINHQYDFRPFINELYRVCKKSAIITFFKPFCDEDDSEIKNSPFKNRYLDGIGVVLDRVTINGEVNCIYSFFSRKEIENYLISKKINYEILKKHDRMFLFLMK